MDFSASLRPKNSKSRKGLDHSDSEEDEDEELIKSMLASTKGKAGAKGSSSAQPRDSDEMNVELVDSQSDNEDGNDSEDDEDQNILSTSGAGNNPDDMDEEPANDGEANQTDLEPTDGESVEVEEEEEDEEKSEGESHQGQAMLSRIRELLEATSIVFVCVFFFFCFLEVLLILGGFVLFSPDDEGEDRSIGEGDVNPHAKPSDLIKPQIRSLWKQRTRKDNKTLRTLYVCV